MSRMYLIRRENLRFIGPISRHEFRERLRRMEFGLQDEVSGHCGAWVIIDREEMVKRHYPELAPIIAEELPAAWREMTGHAKKMTQSDKRAKPSKTSKGHSRSQKSSSRSSGSKQNKRKSSKARNIFMASLLVSMIAVGGGLWLKNRDEQVPPLGDIPQLAVLADPTAFLNEMGLKMIPVTNRIAKSKDVQLAWMPYLRMYAFYTNGAIDGVSQKLLRGAAGGAAPGDCTVEQWKKRWQESSSQISSFISGKSMNRSPWTKALAWDPAWIARRPMKGWIRPLNWYEGCLMSASVAIRSISELQSPIANGVSPAVDDVVALVSRRLQTQIEVIKGVRSSSVATPDTSSFVGVLSCMETVESHAALKACKQKFADPQFDTALEEHYFWQMIRLASANLVTLNDKEMVAELIMTLNKVAPESQIAKLDYSAEIQFFKDFYQNPNKPEMGVSKVPIDFGEVKLKP